MEKFVTVAVYTFVSEYTVLKHLLEQKGITHVFQNETSISVLPFHSNAFGGIRLKVHINDVEITRELIKDLEENPNLYIV